MEGCEVYRQIACRSMQRRRKPHDGTGTRPSRPQRSAGNRRAKNFKGSFRRLLGEFKPLRMKLVLVLFAVVAANIFNITAPRMVEHAIDIVTDALGWVRASTFPCSPACS